MRHFIYNNNAYFATKIQLFSSIKQEKVKILPILPQNSRYSTEDIYIPYLFTLSPFVFLNIVY